MRLHELTLQHMGWGCTWGCVLVVCRDGGGVGSGREVDEEDTVRLSRNQIHFLPLCLPPSYVHQRTHRALNSIRTRHTHVQELLM